MVLSCLVEFNMCFGVLICVVFGLSSGQFSGGPASHIVLPPLGIGEKDIVIIIIPEEDVRNVAYATLAEEIQISSNLPIWIGLMDTSGSTLSTQTFRILWLEIVEELTIQGVRFYEADVFLAGHGSRGSFAAEFAFRDPELVLSVILFGSILPQGQRSSTLPMPVLTLTGELDGLTRITELAIYFREFATDVETDPSLVQQCPVVLLQGCNHALFSDGELSESMEAQDIKSEVNDDDARMLIANYTSRFIASVTGHYRFQESTIKMFQSAFKTAASMLLPITDILSKTKNNALESEWVGLVQKWLSGLGSSDLKRLSVESYILEDATSIPPSIMVSGDKTVIITFSEIYQRTRTSEEIAARMIGPERIQEWFGNTTITKKYNCKDLNYASYLTAYHMASEVARNRYDSYNKGIIFHDDMLMQSDVAWEQSHLLTEVIKHELHVTAPNYQTPVYNDILGEWTGIFFCKLLPLDKALEWIYVEALQNKLKEELVTGR